MNKKSINGTYRNAFRTTALIAISMPTLAQTSVSLNMDYAEGHYGETEKSSAWTIPLIIKHQIGPVAMKLNIPYVRATGVAASGGDRFRSNRQVQEGPGDVVATLSYDLFVNDDGQAIDLGTKIKIPPAGKENDLISTGKRDYSVFVDLFQPIGKVLAFGTVGWTKKGDPDGVHYRDPWYATLGLAYRLPHGFTVGMFHDYRQRVTTRGAPVSETTAYIEHKVSPQLKFQAYVLAGFSDASPDRGAGATVTWSF
jgi:hypothetical protein